MVNPDRFDRLLTPALLIVALLVFGGCGDDETTGPEPTGSVEVTTSTTGESLDPDGYTVTVAGGSGQAIGVNATVTASGVATGARSVELSGVADNCTVAGDNPRDVSVTDGATVSTTFNVTCIGMGSVEVTTSTTGESLDPDGYTVTVAGGTGQPIGIDETLTVDDIATGARSVELTDVADNCTVDGDNPRDVTVAADATVSTTFDVSCAAFLSGVIVFASDRDGGDLQLYTMNPDGTGQTRLSTSTGNDAFVAVSPDGQQVYFSSDRTGDFEIFVVDADGTNPVNLTNSPGSTDAFPALSPDGTRIAFLTNRDGDGEIYLMDTEGGDLTNVTNDPGSDEFADWSPDGSQLLFATDRDGNSEIYRMNADGSGLVNLTNDPGNDTQPAWSPDGSQIAFISDRGGNSDLWVMNADGSGLDNLTEDAGTDELPDWSPDGTRIVFDSVEDGDFEVYSINPDGSGRVQLTANTGTDGGAVYSP